ncbi:MAG: alpha/beta fold hydrolase [Lachnospiraceae bacterium]|nr:alpha/beta fold hydrolase [Lachnospiraceae bacterium]
MKKGVITDYSWRKKRIILWILIILFILLIPTIVTMLYVFRHVKYLNVEDDALHPLQAVYKSSKVKIDSITHTLKTSDGEVLWCSEVEADKPQGVIIYLGAQKEPSVTYFYAHAAWMQKNGYASFLLEVRAHGESSGKKLGLGFTEVEDVRAVVDYIKSVDKYKDLPIVVQGVSLGGSIAINATAEIPEISGCIAMSPFASPDDQWDFYLKEHGIPGFLRDVQRPFTHQAFRWIYGKDVADNMVPKETIKKTGSKPVLVISAKNDPVISIENTFLLQQTKSNAEFWVRDSADHYVIAGNNLMEVSKDKEYCIYLEGFLKKIVLETEK